MAKNLILVQDSAGENVLVNIANIVRVQECDNAGDPKFIEILVREPIVDFGMPAYDWEVNCYYSPLSLEAFVRAYA